MKINFTKKTITLTSIALLLLITVGTTLALIFTNTGDVENTFKPSRVACAVVEGSNDPVESDKVDTGAVKEDVKIKNTGDTDAFIRVAVVVNWMSADGTKVWATAPKLGTDYKIEFGSGWKQGNDEYWYYIESVAPTLLTDPLIKKAEQITKAPDGYFLSIEIVASAIQSSPDTTVETQWKNNKVDIEADNGTLTVINK
jgi:hypothetical protein